MALTARTSTPQALLARIKKLIDEKKIATWQYDAEGNLRIVEIEQFARHRSQQRSTEPAALPTQSDMEMFDLPARPEGGVTGRAAHAEAGKPALAFRDENCALHFR